jgi:5-methylthioribose kinase
MREVTPETAADYLRDTGRVDPGRSVQALALGWGVSNVVIRVDVEGEPPFVLKQARERLRTKALWVSRLDRVWNERDAIRLLGTVFPEGSVPRVLFSDEDNYLFAMTHAPEDSVVWKEQLLAGRTDPAVARRAGGLLATVHAATRDHPALAGRLSDTTVFDELRVDPFYRTIARVHPEIAPQVEALIASMSRAPYRCLVLADFSPKNMLVHSGGLTLVDFETAHAGDPAYDLGFVLSHLYLKAFRAGDLEPGRPGGKPYLDLIAEFLNAYRANDAVAALAGPHPLGDSPPVEWHTAACMLARVDGKSPVDYLDEDTRQAVRTRCLEVLRRAPAA